MFLDWVWSISGFDFIVLKISLPFEFLLFVSSGVSYLPGFLCSLIPKFHQIQSQLLVCLDKLFKLSVCLDTPCLFFRLWEMSCVCWPLLSFFSLQLERVMWQSYEQWTLSDSLLDILLQNLPCFLKAGWMFHPNSDITGLCHQLRYSINS